tara:strand:- start:1236 stop:1490 length:255 start_codon:yes stop_codon:yes gene_type:complete
MMVKLNADDFDFYAKKAIIMMFDELTKKEWDKHFKNAGRTGLKVTKRSNYNEYNPFLVGDWLVRRGHCSRANVNAILMSHKHYR